MKNPIYFLNDKRVVINCKVLALLPGLQLGTMATVLPGNPCHKIRRGSHAWPATEMVKHVKLQIMCLVLVLTFHILL